MRAVGPLVHVEGAEAGRDDVSVVGEQEARHVVLHDELPAHFLYRRYNIILYLETVGDNHVALLGVEVLVVLHEELSALLHAGRHHHPEVMFFKANKVWKPTYIVT